MKLPPVRPLPWLICAALAVGAYILRFHLYGYSFSALVCCCLMALRKRTMGAFWRLGQSRPPPDHDR